MISQRRFTACGYSPASPDDLENCWLYIIFFCKLTTNDKQADFSHCHSTSVFHHTGSYYEIYTPSTLYLRLVLKSILLQNSICR